MASSFLLKKRRQEAANEAVFKTPTADPRAWLGIKTEAMRAPGASPQLDLLRAAQSGRNVASMNQRAMQSAWGGMPTGEAGVGQALMGNIGGYGQEYGGQMGADVGLVNQAQDTQRGFMTAAPGSFNQLQEGARFNRDVAGKYGQMQNERAIRQFQRTGKGLAGDMLARQYEYEGRMK